MDSAIQHLLQRSQCSRCGGKLRLHHILTKQEYVALIETRCKSCQKTAKTLCFDVEALRRFQRDLEIFGGTAPKPKTDPQPQLPNEAISAEDLLAISEGLDGFDGDFRRLFAGRPVGVDEGRVNFGG